MDADRFISDAVRKGAELGLAGLTVDERMVYLISEAEVYCDTEGIDSFLDRYTPAEVAECAAAYAELGAAAIARVFTELSSAQRPVSSDLLDKANALVTDRAGYDYPGLRLLIERRLGLAEGG